MIQTELRPPMPPFTHETAVQKVRMAEDAWNSRDPQRVSLAYTIDAQWRNRAEFPVGREAIVAPGRPSGPERARAVMFANKFSIPANPPMPTMCRNIKQLFNFEPPVTNDEIRAASLQFVRKVSGFNKPSKVNEAAFLAAIEQITAISATLLNVLQTDAHPKNRGEEAEKARVRYVQRFPG